MKKSRFIASILSLSVGITSFSIIPMETFAENGIIKLSESEQITDIYKIYKILSEGLADNEYVKKIEVRDSVIDYKCIIVHILMINDSDKIKVEDALNKLIEDNNIDRSLVLVTPYTETDNKKQTTTEKLSAYIKENNLDAVMYQFGYYPSVAYYEEDKATIEAIDAFLKETNINGLKRIAYKGSKPEGGMITDYAFIYEKLYQLIEDKKITAVIWMTLSVDGQTVEANSIKGYNEDFSSVTSMRLEGTYAVDEKSIAAVEEMFSEENIDPRAIDWLMLEDGPLSNNTKRGDANCDGELSMADAVLIMQYIANPAKYGIEGTNENHITEQGKKNADIAGENDGITNADALAIQKKLLKLD